MHKFHKVGRAVTNRRWRFFGQIAQKLISTHPRQLARPLIFDLQLPDKSAILLHIQAWHGAC
jgi:hypothetical protein